MECPRGPISVSFGKRHYTEIPKERLASLIVVEREDGIIFTIESTAGTESEIRQEMAAFALRQSVKEFKRHPATHGGHAI